MNVSITNSDRADKRFKAVFTDKDGKKVKTTHFGLKNFAKGTFIDHGNNKLKNNYLKRHAPRENWDDMFSAGALSRWILWNKKSLASSISDFKSRFKLK